MRAPEPFPSLAPSPVRTPVWRIVIAGKDVTRDVTPMTISVSYVDHSHGKSDDVELLLEDAMGKWRGPWYPTKGDTLGLWIGYEGQPLLDCGRFEIDELEPSGPPDILSLRALASGVTPALRTKRSKAYEGQTLREVAHAIAAAHGLTLDGTIGDMRIGRLTQHREDDLTFLTRLAEQYGYVFTVKGTRLVFYAVASLEAAPPVFTIRRGEVKEYRFKDTTHKIYRAAKVTHDDPVTKKPITQEVAADGVVTGDILTLDDRAENAQQAIEQAKAALRAANSHEVESSITVEGNQGLVAGVTANLVGWGAVDGVYHADTTTHKVTRGDGYTTTAEFKTIPGAKKIKVPTK